MLTGYTILLCGSASKYVYQKRKSVKDRSWNTTFFENPSKLVLEGRIFDFEFFDEIFRVNWIIVLAPPSSRDLAQCGMDSLSIRVIMQGQHYFPSSFLVTGLLPMRSILFAMTSPWKSFVYYFTGSLRRKLLRILGKQCTFFW